MTSDLDILRGVQNLMVRLTRAEAYKGKYRAALRAIALEANLQEAVKIASDALRECEHDDTQDSFGAK